MALPPGACVTQGPPAVLKERSLPGPMSLDSLPPQQGQRTLYPALRCPATEADTAWREPLSPQASEEHGRSGLRGSGWGAAPGVLGLSRGGVTARGVLCSHHLPLHLSTPASASGEGTVVSLARTARSPRPGKGSSQVGSRREWPQEEAVTRAGSRGPGRWRQWPPVRLLRDPQPGPGH